MQRESIHVSIYMQSISYLIMFLKEVGHIRTALVQKLPGTVNQLLFLYDQICNVYESLTVTIISHHKPDLALLVKNNNMGVNKTRSRKIVFVKQFTSGKL